MRKGISYLKIRKYGGNNTLCIVKFSKCMVRNR